MASSSHLPLPAAPPNLFTRKSPAAGRRTPANQDGHTLSLQHPPQPRISHPASHQQTLHHCIQEYSENRTELKTITGLYRSCAALACLSGTFDLISFEAVNFEIIVEKVWFGLERRFGQTDKINGFWFALVEFGLSPPSALHCCSQLV